MLPNFLVIGAPRAGTTWIYENLIRHPQVYVPHKKELHFFDKDYDKGIDHYESFFARRKDEIAIGETTPAYLHGAYSTRDIPSLIRRHLPDVKLIASLRNPLERAYSRYWHSKARYESNVSLSFEDKLKDRPEFIQEGFYANQLARYYEHFPKDQILVLLYDDMLSAPVQFMESIYAFIGVDPQFDAGLGSLHVNASAGKDRLAKSKVKWVMSQMLTHVGLLSAADAIRKGNSVKIPPMNPETRRMLIDVYRDENARLGHLIGRELEAWNR
jgi:hypothetical protein